MLGLKDYIFLYALIYISISFCGGVVTEAREANRTKNAIYFSIACSIYAIIVGSAMTPTIMTALLQGGVFNRIVLCIYVTVNAFAHLRFMHKKVNGNICTGRCKNLKNVWICCVIIYSLLLGFCLFKMNIMIIIISSILYMVYCSCILAFDYYFKEEPFKEWEEMKHELLPLKQLSVNQYREWSKKRERRLRKQTLVFAAVYQAVFIAFILAAAKRITLLAILIILILYSLTLGSLLLRWNIRLKDIESRKIESACRGKAVIETASPVRIRYMDAEGEFQSRVVEKVQRKKYKQGTLVDIVIENGEVVLAERNLPM